MNIPRPEHPKPQFERVDWLNLNGQWQFEFDNSRSGIERKLYEDCVELSREITVPFCPESELSGIGETDFCRGVVYKRKFTLPEGWEKGVTKLHFGAVDYVCYAYVNGESVGSHTGGYVSFSFDITSKLKVGENSITVFAHDDTTDSKIPSGKQSGRYASYGCFYTRTTGIWQTVWLEHMPETHIRWAKYTTDIENGVLNVNTELCGAASLSATAYYDGKAVGNCTVEATGGNITFSIALDEVHLWEIGKGNLYDLVLEYGCDRVKSYFGLRSVMFRDGKFYLNGKCVFQRLILDQGFYPDGIYTAPTDEALKNDIQLSLNCGFNGARPHEKIFEERWLYHCDKLGYIVWGEYPDWGLDHTKFENLTPILNEWLEELHRDFNHPSIIGWCPRNESWSIKGHRQSDEAVAALYRITKSIDPTRPCIDSSGSYHTATDVFDYHTYIQDPATFKERLNELFDDKFILRLPSGEEQKFDGSKPFFVSEYGGIGWTDDQSGWGYGNAPKTPEEFLARFKGLTDVLLDNSKIMGLCYTQLTDVEQEQNGLYTYDRKPKFDVCFFKDVLSRKATIED